MFEERDDRTGHRRIRVHPFECRLSVGVGIVEVFEVPMPRPLQGLHGHDAHVLLVVRAIDDLIQLGPDAMVVGEHHHIEAARVDRLVRNSTSRGVWVETPRNVPCPPPSS